jgi:ABC-type sugar transport system ATPase subunit
MSELRVEEVQKEFPDGTVAVDRVSFVARAGRVLTLLGPSGCGKSTLLRIVAGLEVPTGGRMVLDGERLDDRPVGQRDVGFVFQNYALYPHLTVEGNLSLALETRHVARDEIRARVREIARMLGIEELLIRRPAQLSGGQQQRVALGRALVRRPRLCLLDEPLSNLDALLRESMRSELRALFTRLGATVIYVTHDQTEAMTLSDDLLVMRKGRVLQAGAPVDVFRRPADLFVATFVGSPRMTIWQGHRNGAALECRGVAVPFPPGLAGDGGLCVGIRPEEAELSSARLEDGWPAQRVMMEPQGARMLVTVRVGGEQARVLAEPHDWPEQLWLRWPPERLHWFDEASGARLEPASEPPIRYSPTEIRRNRS